MPSTRKGLEKSRDVYGFPAQRMTELKAEGRKIIGYPCIYVPVEIITALDLVPYRTCGKIGELVTVANEALPAAFCSVMRSCLDCGLKRKDDFLDGMVTVHSCDPQEKTSRVWEAYTCYSYFHFIDMPGNVHPEAIEYFMGQLKDFGKTLEMFAGRKLTSTDLERAVQLHNRQRALVRELYEFAKSNPPLVLASEILRIIRALTSLPVQEGNDLLFEILEEIRKREPIPRETNARLLLWSSTLHDEEILQILESVSSVVMVEACGGVRSYRTDVGLKSDPFLELSRYYLTQITCARTFRQANLSGGKKEYLRDLEDRFGYIKDLALQWSVNGVILLLAKYCDPFGFEMLAVKDYLKIHNIPSIYIEYDYHQLASASLMTRVQAFAEIISQE